MIKNNMHIDFKKFNENSYVLDSVLLWVEYVGLCAKYKAILKLKLDKWHPKLKWIITKSMGRAIYSIVHNGKKINTGLTSKMANAFKKFKLNNSGVRVTKDHLLKPQLWGEFFFDNGSHYYTGTKSAFKQWQKIMNYLCHTTNVTSKENDLLSMQTHRDDDTKQLDRYTLLEDSYSAANIELETLTNGFIKSTKFPLSLPIEFVKWEKQLVNDIEKREEVK
jgi:hypothetical protein